MKKQQLRLALIDGDPCLVLEDCPTSDDHFAFNLHHKSLNLDGIELDHWWMDIKSVYPTRNRQAGNFSALLAYWWQSCVAHQTNCDTAVCESLLLSNLFPKTRSNGSRRVMLDSVLKQNKSERRVRLDSLEGMLATAFDNEKSILEFSRETGRMLGPPDFSDGVRSAYEAFVNDLLHPAVKQLQRGNLTDALALADEVWSVWHRKFGRRANKDNEKEAIDIVSYEARAAVHRCYAHAWETICNWVSTDQGGSPKSFVFHRLWHLDLAWPSKEYADRSFHLFHGHVLGLHPAAGSFIQTPTGRRLLSAWLQVAIPGWEFSDNPETPELRRLLNGLWIAVTDYTIQHGDSNFERRTKSLQI